MHYVHLDLSFFLFFFFFYSVSHSVFLSYVIGFVNYSMQEPMDL